MDAKLKHALTQLAEYYKLIGDEYRQRAYSRAAEGARPGSHIQQLIDEFNSTGRVQKAESVAQKVAAYEKFAQFLGVGPKLAAKWIKKGYTSIKDVPQEQLNRMQKLGIKHAADLQTPIPRQECEEIIACIYNLLHEYIARFDATGSYRRGAASSNDIDLLIQLKSNVAACKIVQKLQNDSHFIDVISQGASRIVLLWKQATTVRQVDLLFAPADEYIAALCYFTGSKSHNVYLRGIAKQQGMILNQKGLWQNSRKIDLQKEEDIYNTLNIPYQQPHER